MAPHTLYLCECYPREPYFLYLWQRVVLARPPSPAGVVDSQFGEVAVLDGHAPVVELLNPRKAQAETLHVVPVNVRRISKLISGFEGMLDNGEWSLSEGIL